MAEEREYGLDEMPENMDTEEGVIPEEEVSAESRGTVRRFRIFRSV